VGHLIRHFSLLVKHGKVDVQNGFLFAGRVALKADFAGIK
jgi:hypothetical protein